MTSNATSTSIASSKPAYFLGLDLTPEALRGVVIDDTLDVVAADCVLFENNAGSFLNPNVNIISASSSGIPNQNPSPNPLLNPSHSHSQPSTPAPISPSSAPAPTLSISAILIALDSLLSKLASRTNLGCVRSISGSTFPAAVFYHFDARSSPSFGSVLDNDRTDANATLDSLFFLSSSSPSSGSSFSSPFFPSSTVPTPTDTSTTPFAHLLQDTQYGSASIMAAKCGTSAFAGPVSGLIAAQMMKLRVTMPEAWKNVDSVSGLGGLLIALLTGRCRPSLSVTDALMSGLLDYGSLAPAPQKSKSEWEWKWDVNTVKFVAGVENSDGNEAESEVQRVLNMINNLSSEGSGKGKEDFIANYFIRKYGFGKDTTVHTFTSTHLATYLSLIPTSSDAVLSFGPQDAMIMSTQGSVSVSGSSLPSISPQPSTLGQNFPHPVQTQVKGGQNNLSRKWVSVLNSRNGDIPRMLVRDMYTKSWSAFDRLVAIVPPGGSIGLDDKLFSYWLVQPEYESSYVASSSSAFSNSTKVPTQAQSQGQAKPTRGIYRFENGTKVNEFRDLRANPRCLIEGQIMGFRTRFGRLVTTGSGAAINSGDNPGTNSDPSANSNGSVTLNGRHTTAASTTLTPNGHSHGYPTSPSISSTLSPSSSSFLSTTPATSASTSPALPFSPYVSTALPKRIFAIGSASYFPSIVNVVGEVFNCPVFVPQSVLEEGVVWAALVTAIQQSSGSGAGEDGSGDNEKEKDIDGLTGEENSGSSSDLNGLGTLLARIPSRAALGGSYLARWGWKQATSGVSMLNSSSVSTASNTSFEDDIKWLLAKRWAQAQSSSQHQASSGAGQQHLNTTGAGLGVGLGFGLGGGPVSSLSTSPFSPSFGHSPSSAPSSLASPLSSYLSKTPSRRGLHRAKSNLALASEIVVEEDEEEEGDGADSQVIAGTEEDEESAPRESGVFKYPIPGSSSAGNVSSTSLLPNSSHAINLTVTPTPTPTFTSQSITQPLVTSVSTALPTLTLTTTNPNTQHQHQPGPLTSLLGPLPTPAPITSTLHPISALATNDADAQFGLVKVAEPDEDAFVCYASMLFEWVRLEGGIWGGVW